MTQVSSQPMVKFILIQLFFLAFANDLLAQESIFNYQLQMLGGYCGPSEVPFWLRSNQFGNEPPSGTSLGLIGAAKKDYNPIFDGRIDWGCAIEGRISVGNPMGFILTEGYGKIRNSVFELKAGRVKEITGLCDTTLTSGSWSVSGNAPGIPKVQLSIPEFYTLPYFGKLLAIKGSYMHGWIGNWHMDGEVIKNTPTYLHQKTLYGRFGKPSWKLKLYGGFNHQTIWGNEKDIMGEDYELTSFQTFIYVNAGKAYNNDSIKKTRVGNHLGSIDLALTYDFNKLRLFIYRQNFYDAGALAYFANIMDGLNGISFINLLENNRNIQWKKILIEFLYTKNQAGEKWSRQTPSHFENYYNNGYYHPGWSYKEKGIGNPFISPEHTIKEDLPVPPGSYFTNNRVVLLHVGFECLLFGWNLSSRLSYSRNYGTYYTSTTGKPFKDYVLPSPYGVFPTSGQFSALFKTAKCLKNRVEINVLTAFDKGKLLNDSFGVYGGVSKYF